jgi:hypothetical protein
MYTPGERQKIIDATSTKLAEMLCADTSRGEPFRQKVVSMTTDHLNRVLSTESAKNEMKSEIIKGVGVVLQNSDYMSAILFKSIITMTNFTPILQAILKTSYDMTKSFAGTDNMKSEFMNNLKLTLENPMVQKGGSQTGGGRFGFGSKGKGAAPGKGAPGAKGAAPAAGKGAADAKGAAPAAGKGAADAKGAAGAAAAAEAKPGKLSSMMGMAKDLMGKARPMKLSEGPTAPPMPSASELTSGVYLQDLLSGLDFRATEMSKTIFDLVKSAMLKHIENSQKDIANSVASAMQAASSDISQKMSKEAYNIFVYGALNQNIKALNEAISKWITLEKEKARKQSETEVDLSTIASDISVSAIRDNMLQLINTTGQTGGGRSSSKTPSSIRRSKRHPFFRKEKRQLRVTKKSKR